MNPVGALIIYVLLWWVTLFAVLPFGTRSRWEEKDDGVKGADPGAPASINFKRKIIQTSLIALGLWVVTIAIILSGIITYRN